MRWDYWMGAGILLAIGLALVVAAVRDCVRYGDWRCFVPRRFW